MTDNSFQQLAQARGIITQGCNNLKFIELLRGKQILYTPYEPDPETCREEYFYDTRQNVLYRKVSGVNPLTRKAKRHWKRISQY